MFDLASCRLSFDVAPPFDVDDDDDDDGVEFIKSASPSCESSDRVSSTLSAPPGSVPKTGADLVS